MESALWILQGRPERGGQSGRGVPALMALVFVGAVSFVCYGNSREVRLSSKRSTRNPYGL